MQQALFGVVLVSLIAGLSCQFVPTADHNACFDQFVANNSDHRFVTGLSNCEGVADSEVCGVEDCLTALEGIFTPCGYDILRGS